MRAHWSSVSSWNRDTIPGFQNPAGKFIRHALELAEDDYTIAKTTNPLEGGPNKAIKDFLRAHRGLNIDHARRGVDWLLYLRTEAPKDPWSFVTPRAWTPPRSVPNVVKPDTGREETNLLYGTGFSVEDGNGIQKGWGGRTR